MKKIVYVGIAVMTLLIAGLYQGARRTICGLGSDRLSIATVQYGPFTEYIPQTGIAELDSITKIPTVRVPVDEHYVRRIKAGLLATTTINNKDYMLVITRVDPQVQEGRFNVYMNFKEEVPSDLSPGKSIRLRIELGEPDTAMLLPVGGFYKDTGGQWVFLVKGRNLAVRQNIKLGRKMGSEYFEVLEGLNSGDQVITSSYESFLDEESLNLEEFEKIRNFEGL